MNPNPLKKIQSLLNFAIFLSFTVVILGAYTRLTDAGLGCPDWPGCYGHLVLPDSSGQLIEAQQKFPDSPIESPKAWTEMIHRYAAGCLLLIILWITWAMYQLKKLRPTLQSCFDLLLGLNALILFQAALGMWTVTLKLLPIVVMSHLLGGMLIFSLLSILRLKLSNPLLTLSNKRLEPLKKNNTLLLACLGSLFVVVFQIALGGWVSANYAGLACIGFPACNGQWIPTLHFTEGFNLFLPVGENYQGGLLQTNLRITIQWIHRLGAFITLITLTSLITYILKNHKHTLLRSIAIACGFLVSMQFLLGIVNVVYLLPLWAAVAHNAFAALLLASLFLLVVLASEHVGQSYAD